MTDYQLQKQREYRKHTGNKVTKIYEKTKQGFLMRLYRNMKSRVNGIQKAKYHLYKDKYLMPEVEFYDWALRNSTFHTLFEAYELSGYERKLAPSVDRIDSSLGYEFENIEFVTMSENSRRSNVNKNKIYGNGKVNPNKSKSN